jgi:hypothetical protein
MCYKKAVPYHPSTAPRHQYASLQLSNLKASITMTTEPPSPDFSRPWVQTLLNDPVFPPVHTHSIVAYLPPNTENSLLAISLAKPSCVRAIRSFHHHPPSPSLVGNETRMIFSLGDGVNGHSGYCAGGFIGILVDEVTGQCAACVCGRELITAEIQVRYKKMLPTPRVILCRRLVFLICMYGLGGYLNFNLALVLECWPEDCR